MALTKRFFHKEDKVQGYHIIQSFNGNEVSAERANEIGRKLEEKYQFPYLYSDFKKREGYKRSIVLSHQYHLYRQDYCGCRFSKKKKREE